MEKDLNESPTISINGLEWLHAQTRDNCRCCTCWNSLLQQGRKVNVIDYNVRVIDYTVDINSGRADMTWSDGHQGHIMFISRPDNCNSTWDSIQPVLWSQSEAYVPEVYQYNDLITNISMRFLCYMNILHHGIVQIRNAPILEGEIMSVATTLGLGPAWRSVFGDMFTVRNKPSNTQFGNQAYTSLPLALHTDLPYYEPPPDIFLFSCREAALSGGESLYCDGFAAAYALKKSYPEYFTILSTIKVINRDDTPEWQLLSMRPIIEIDPTTGCIFRISDNPAARDTAAANLDTPLSKDWYAAYARYRHIVDDMTTNVVFKMEPGDITIFDGRNAFDVSSNRCMDGMYTMRSHLHSTLRKLQIEMKPK